MDGWTRIADRLPEKGAAVWLWPAGGGSLPVDFERVVAAYSDGERWEGTDAKDRFHRLPHTHWRPREEPPPPPLDRVGESLKLRGQAASDAAFIDRGVVPLGALPVAYVEAVRDDMVVAPWPIPARTWLYHATAGRLSMMVVKDGRALLPELMGALLFVDSGLHTPIGVVVADGVQVSGRL